MKPLQWIWALIVVLAGASMADAVVTGMAQQSAQETPDGWYRAQEQVPFRRADLLGELSGDVHSYTLDHHMAMSANQPSDTWDITLQLGKGSEVRLLLSGRIEPPRPGAEQSTAGNRVLGDGLLIRRARGGAVTGLHFLSKSSSPLQCQGSLPIPGADPYTLRFERTRNGFRAQSGDATMQCSSQRSQGVPTLMSGLHRVRILESHTAHASFAAPPAPSRSVAILIGIFLSMMLWWAERKAGTDFRVAALTSLPLLQAWPLQGANSLGLVEQLRIPGLTPYFLAFWIPLFICLIFKVSHHSARLAKRAKTPFQGVGAAAVIGGISGLTLSIAGQPHYTMAYVYFAVAGLLFGGLIGVNAVAQRLRGVNLFSLAFIIGGFFSLEWGVRFTETGVTWSPTGRMQFDEQLGWTSSTISDFEALEKGQHKTYPDSGYPIAIPTQKSAQRLICLGSSATGGAFQNDNLSEFYPARLQELLGSSMQVINQGVGGWTSFHMARYAQQKADELNPDIITLYIGHNDVLTKSKKPYKALFGDWKSGKNLTTPLPSVRLFQGLRFAINAFRAPSGNIAVPVDHAEENVRMVHEIAKAHNAKLLVIPEAITPDSAALFEYDAMLQALAKTNNDIAYLDAPSLLLDATGDFFLDDVHLTDQGHRRLAQAIHQKLQDEKWIVASE